MMCTKRPLLNVTNITCTFSIGCRISHSYLKNKLLNIEIKKNILIVRLRKPKATALVFESGSVSMSGLTTIFDCQNAARKVLRKLQKTGYSVALKNLIVQNVAFSSKVPWSLNLAKLTEVLDDYVSYGEGCSAATVFGDGSKRFRYFHTGSIIITGYKDINEATRDFDCVLDVATLIRKDGAPQV